MKHIINVKSSLQQTLPYPIILGENLLSQILEFLPADVASYNLVIITDNRVKGLYAEQLLKALAKHKGSVDLYAFPAGEQSKTSETKSKIEGFLFKKHLGRDTCLIALGGGVVGDITGFVAATYMRGIPYIQVPTTLLAMIDSSVGGKTAINTPEGKNLIGAFHDPIAVIADMDCLDTLPQKQFTNGWIEALKIFLVGDALSFNKSYSSAPSLELIHKAIALKADIVERDPKEKNIRAMLNFGHTLGHAIEKASDYQLLHGHAVGYGILIESHVSMQRKLLPQADFEKIVSALSTLGLRGSDLAAYKFKSIQQAMMLDKKSKNKEIRCVLLQAIGHVYMKNDQVAHAITGEEVQSAVAALIGAQDAR